MVPAHSHKVSRVSWYSGSCHARSPFVYGAFTLSGWLSQNHSTRLTRQSCSPNPGVHALRFGLFRVRSPLLTESHVVFSSSGYLDVSVHRVPFHSLWIGLWILEVFSSRFPHSEISGSMDICSSPKLFAAYHDVVNITSDVLLNQFNSLIFIRYFSLYAIFKVHLTASFISHQKLKSLLISNHW